MTMMWSLNLRALKISTTAATTTTTAATPTPTIPIVGRLDRQLSHRPEEKTFVGFSDPGEWEGAMKSLKLDFWL